MFFIDIELLHLGEEQRYMFVFFFVMNLTIKHEEGAIIHLNSTIEVKRSTRNTNYTFQTVRDEEKRLLQTK